MNTILQLPQGKPDLAAITDAHAGNGQLADDSIHPVSKHGQLQFLARWCVLNGVPLYLLGDMWEIWGVGRKNQDSIFKKIPHRLTWEALEEAIRGGVLGNHDWDLKDSYVRRFHLSRNGLLLNLDGYAINLRHGQEFDVNPSARTSGPVRWMARGAYLVEGYVWPGIDTWALERVKEYQDRQRMLRNGHPSEVPYWWGAVQVKTQDPSIDALLMGHSHLPIVRDLPVMSRKITLVQGGCWTINPQTLQQAQDVVLFWRHPEPTWRVLDVSQLPTEM